jgi:cyclic pyranopterin phosphate synthase
LSSLLPLPTVRNAAAPAIVDVRGRALRDLRISLTDHCNLRCTYCMPAHRFGSDHAFLSADKLLTFEEIVTLVKVAAGLGLRKVKLTGGEPLLRPSLPRLLRMIREAAPSIELALITNGILLAPLAAELRESGLDRITVSLDSLRPERFAAISGRGPQLDKVLAGIEAARRAGFHPIKINMVVIRDVNDDEVVPMANFFRGTDTILRFIEYMDVGTLNRWQPCQVVGAAEILERLRRDAALEPMTRDYRGETAERYRYTDGSGEIGFIASVTQPFCGDCNRLRLSADGQIFGCLFSNEGYDLARVLRTQGETAARDALIRFWLHRQDQYSIERNTRATPEKIEMFYIGG